MTESQLRALPSFRQSEEFSETEVFLELVEAMTLTPTHVSDDLRRALLQRFSEAQLAELTAEIAWENQWGRLNEALGIRPVGFSEGAFCALPER